MLAICGQEINQHSYPHWPYQVNHRNKWIVWMAELPGLAVGHCCGSAGGGLCFQPGILPPNQIHLPSVRQRGWCRLNHRLDKALQGQSCLVILEFHTRIWCRRGKHQLGVMWKGGRLVGLDSLEFHIPFEWGDQSAVIWKQPAARHGALGVNNNAVSRWKQLLCGLVCGV